MSQPTPPLAPPDPDLRTRHLVALFLRAGLGINLLNAGIVGYLTVRAGGSMEAYQTALPYLEIFLGLALILGIFSLPSAVCAAIFVIFQPLMQTVFLVTGGVGGTMRGPWPAMFHLMDAGSTSNMLLAAAVIWFSPAGRNPWSVDSMIFGRRGVAPRVTTTPKSPPPPLDLPPAPPPGERTSTFLSQRET